MMFARKAIGLEICPDRVRMALVGGSRSKPVLEAMYETPLPEDTLRVSLREPNILLQAAFVAVVRETALRLLAPTTRTSVSLPDAAGRVMIVDLDTRFKSRDEGADIIRWKLKKNFPFDIKDAHFDFQVLQEKGSGEISVLVSLVCRQVLQQYEELLVEAGLEPNQIDFTTFRLHELFAPRFALDEDYAFICHAAGVLSVMLFRGGVLSFYRAKELIGRSFSVNRLYREISSSLHVYQDKSPGLTVGKVFCSVAPEHSEDFRALVADATNQEPVILDPERVVTRTPSCMTDTSPLFSMTAAIGAAVRNL